MVMMDIFTGDVPGFRGLELDWIYCFVNDCMDVLILIRQTSTCIYITSSLCIICGP